MKSQKGSAILFVIISMLFFLSIVIGLYINTNNKIQKQEKEIQQIQKEYTKENVDKLYEETYNELTKYDFENEI